MLPRGPRRRRGLSLHLPEPQRGYVRPPFVRQDAAGAEQRLGLGEHGQGLAADGVSLVLPRQADPEVAPKDRQVEQVVLELLALGRGLAAQSLSDPFALLPQRTTPGL